MKSELEKRVAEACKELFDVEIGIELARPEEQFGDYATNVALQLSKPLGKNPREIGEALAVKLREILAGQVSEVSVAGPGFINLKLNDQALAGSLEAKPAQSLAGQVVVAEYSDPNPFKVLHAGHLYTSVVGDAIANLLEQAGATVHRVNFGGDVGLHVGKTMWAICGYLGGEHPDKLADVPVAQRPDWLTQRYIDGNAAYEESEKDDKFGEKAKIIDYNKRVYQLHTDNDHDSPFAQIYWTCRQWSYDYFDGFYERIGTKFEKYYPESETAPLGLQTVREHIGKVYEESDGAVIFDGEKYGLHARVFINSEGLPTYEAKDVGLVMKKWQDYKFDQSVVITGNDIIEYMRVVLKSIEQFMPELAARSRHLTHGIVKLKGGAKMSSRHGNILRAADVLDAAAEASQKLTDQNNEQTVLGAVKYAFLKSRVGGDIIYDPEESVSLEGNSGPYLQYAHARARSILRKAENTGSLPKDAAFEPGERSLARKISEYPETVDKAVGELMPHHVCTYLYELAQVFNRFYEHNRVIGDPRHGVRLGLVSQYARTLKSGLELLGIAVPEQM
jgi:arginyl-tRNA synthetase